MKNKQYELYDLPQIRDLKGMLGMHAENIGDRPMFRYHVGKRKIEEKTYAEFYEEMLALGVWFFENNIKDKHIAIIGENSYEWLLTFFSVVNGGNVAIPIDKELPREEIEKLIKKADVDIVFCSDAYLDLVEQLQTKVYKMSAIPKYMDMGLKAISKGNKEYIDYKIDVEKVSCILFTSGTSGDSKGVCITQKNLAFDINNGCKLFYLAGNSIALLPFHHSFGLVVGMMMVLNYGRCIYINKSLKNIKASIGEAKPQTMFLVPLFIETFHKQIWENAKNEKKDILLKVLMKVSDMLLKMGIDIRRKCFSSIHAVFGGKLEYIISGGAAINENLIKEFRIWGVEILNAYGITECSPGVAVNRNFYHKDGTAGLPVPETKVMIANDGEVLVAGGHVMKRYYKDEEATKNAFYREYYKTGDLGYLDDDGFLVITGRKKNLIILSNGENISPEELEQDLLKDMAVNEVLVFEMNGKIVAEIYPEEEYLDNNEYFNLLVKQVNSNRPVYKQINEIKLRDVEFEKNTSKKIVRHKNIKRD